jgi:hypothetical protein
MMDRDIRRQVEIAAASVGSPLLFWLGILVVLGAVIALR